MTDFASPSSASARSRATSMCRRSLRREGVDTRRGGQPQCLAAGRAAFRDARGVAARWPADRCGGALHAAAGSSRARRRRRWPPASMCCWRSRRARPWPSSIRLIALARARPGARCLRPGIRATRRRSSRRGEWLATRQINSVHDHLEGRRAGLASRAGLDLGAGRARRVRSRHQRAVDPDPHPAAAGVRHRG